ncbi:MAG: hypothetical protein RLZZ76_705 [Candidatus Parcubacteria bacterium]|jgi:thiamine biosynthesis lipoprotein
MQEEFEYNGKAMGTSFSVAIVGSDKQKADEVATHIINSIASFEARFSRFKEESELTLINEKKHMVVSSDFLSVLQSAQILFQKTKGIFNPLVQVSRLGYTKNFDDLKNTIPENEETDTEYDIDFSTTGIDAQTHTVTLGVNQKLDFGGFLKGYLATKLCSEIMDSSDSFTGAIVNIGGDLHTQGMDAEGQPFVFEVFNPITNTDIPIAVTNKSLVTSGTYKRTWTYHGLPVHHIVDTTGAHNPDTEIVSATILHRDGAFAEAYAKVFIATEPRVAQQIINDDTVAFLVIKKNGEIISNFI